MEYVTDGRPLPDPRPSRPSSTSPSLSSMPAMPFSCFLLSLHPVSHISVCSHVLGAPMAPVRLCSCLRQAKPAGPRQRSKQEPWLKLQCAAPPCLRPNLPGRPPLFDPVQHLVDQLDASRGRASALEPLDPLRSTLVAQISCIHVGEGMDRV